MLSVLPAAARAKRCGRSNDEMRPPPPARAWRRVTLNIIHPPWRQAQAVSSRSAKPLLTGDTLSLKQAQDKQMRWLIFGHWCRYLLGNIRGHVHGHRRGVLARPALADELLCAGAGGRCKSKWKVS